jgi:cytosine/adenosine deaminase-related metal-dependent hydrolase
VLLLADWVIPVSSAPLVNAGVRVADRRIVEVGPAAKLRARYGGEEIRSFPGCALLPGFVNSHTHLELSAFRGFARPSTFGPWLLRLLLARRKLAPADYEASALWGAYECLRCGVTSIADTAYDGPAVAHAAGEAGLRARVYQEVFGLDDAVLPAAMERLESAVGRLRDGAGLLVEAGVSPDRKSVV